MFKPARKLCYYGGKLRKIFGCIEFKLELTRAITDKKNARNVGECITCIIPPMSKLPSASRFSGLCQTLSG